MVTIKTAIFALILFITFWVVNALAQDPFESIFWEQAHFGQFIDYTTPDVKKIYRFELENGEIMHTDIDSKVTFSWKLDIFHQVNPQPINPPYPHRYYFFRITVSDYDRINVPSDVIVNINGAFRYYYNADKDIQADQIRVVAYSPEGWFNVNGDIRANLQSRIITQSFGEVDPGSFPKFGTSTDFAIIARDAPVPNPSSENPGENSGNPPPTGNSDDPSGENSSNPPPTGNSGNPPPTGSSGGSGNPPPTGSSGGSGNPPTGQSSNPSTGNSGNPPATGSSGNSGNPGENSSNPPPTGNSGNPPAGESNNNPGHSTNQPGNSQQPQKSTDEQVRNEAQGNRTAWLLAIAIAVFTIVLDIVM